jgi:hypothetical protein
VQKLRELSLETSLLDLSLSQNFVQNLVVLCFGDIASSSIQDILGFRLNGLIALRQRSNVDSNSVESGVLVAMPSKSVMAIQNRFGILEHGMKVNLIDIQIDARNFEKR